MSDLATLMHPTSRRHSEAALTPRFRETARARILEEKISPDIGQVRARRRQGRGEAGRCGGRGRGVGSETTAPAYTTGAAQRLDTMSSSAAGEGSEGESPHWTERKWGASVYLPSLA